MPRKRSKKGFYHKKRQKANERKEEAEPQDLDSGKHEHEINLLASDVLEMKAGDTSCNFSKNSKLHNQSPEYSKEMAANMTSHPLKDLMVDIQPQNTSVSGLTSSVNSNDSNDTRLVTSAAKIMVGTLEMLKTPQLQKKAFTIAI